MSTQKLILTLIPAFLTTAMNAHAGDPVPPVGRGYHGPDLVHAYWEGTRTSNGGPCMASYQTLDYAPTELVISFQLRDDEQYDSAMAGLFEISNFSKALFDELLLGTKPARRTLSQRGWNFELAASTAGPVRTVEMVGEYADPNSPVTRRLTGTLTYDPQTQMMSFKKKEERKRVLFGFGTVFEDECVNMKPVVRYQK